MKSIKAVVLAGGLGTRLRPITCTTPKPLCKILGESVIERLIRLMPQWNINEVSISTMYKSDSFYNLNEKLSSKLKITYVTEPKPLGSAGGAKYAAGALDIEDSDIFLILSGDGIFDFDLKKAIEFHQAKNSDVTIITTLTKEPLEYGVILSDKNGKIYSFTEKPNWANVKSNTVNTGIYLINGNIFKEIPNNRTFDFSNDLFPFLMCNNKILYAYETAGYWCDIGDIAAYYRCNMEALAGKISNIDFSDALTENELREQNINFKSPCYISKFSKIAQNAEISSFSVIGKNVVIDENAVINSSIIFDNTVICKNTVISNAIICENCLIESDAVIMPGSTIGAGTVIQSGAIVSDGINIWPDKTIEKGFCVTDDVFLDSKIGNLYSDEGYYVGSSNAEINSEYISKLGNAFAKASIKHSNSTSAPFQNIIGVMHDGSAISALICESLLCGAKSAGIKCYSFTKGFEALAKYACAEFLTDITLFASVINKELIIKAFDKNGENLSHEFERTVESCLKKRLEKNSENVLLDVKETIYFDNLKYGYFCKNVKKIRAEFNTPTPLKGINCIVESYNNASDALKEILQELGSTVLTTNNTNTFDVQIILNNNGLEASVKCKNSLQKNVYFDSYHITAAIISYEISKGNTFGTLPYFASFVFGDDTKKIVKFQNDSLLSYDMCYAVPMLLAIAKSQKKSLYDIYNEIPVFEINIKNINTLDVLGEKRASVMRYLHEKYGNKNNLQNDGVKISFDKGNVTVVPRRSGGFKIVSEALTAECAEEIGNIMLEEIKNIK